MGRKIVCGILLTVLMLSMLTWTFDIQPVKAESKTIYVDDDNSTGPWDGTPEHPYQSITSALDHASANDTIYVYSGTYYEHVVVNELITLVGEDKYTTIIDGSGTGIVVNVTADNVNIREFTIRNGGGGIDVPPYEASIFMNGSCGNNVSDNIVSNSGRGIYLRYSYDNIIEENMVAPNNGVGIHLFSSGNTTIINNTITNNLLGGINLEISENNILIGNTILNNPNGIRLTSSGDNFLRNNNMTSNTYNLDIFGLALSTFIQSIDSSNTVDGKSVYYWVNQHDNQIPSDAGYVAAVNSTNITVRDLNMTKNGQGVLFAYTTSSTIKNVNASNNIEGIVLSSSSDNTVSGNTIASNTDGIYERNSNDNTIFDNTITDNDSGVVLIACNGNTIYHNNFINNMGQASLYSSLNNTWDNGYPSGGNYWSDYYDEDQDGDGIGDTPYLIEENNQDNYPLMNPYILGDVNLDGIVDIFDVVLSAKAFDSKPGDPNWNEAADLNNDDVVDIFDIVLLANNFGKTT